MSPHLPEYVCQIWLRSDGRVETKGGGVQTDRQTDRQTDIQTDRKTDRQTDRQAGRQADRQTDRQADRQNDTACLYLEDYLHAIC